MQRSDNSCGILGDLVPVLARLILNRLFALGLVDQRSITADAHGLPAFGLFSTLRLPRRLFVFQRHLHPFRGDKCPDSGPGEGDGPTDLLICELA